jgi:hypothetical protein
VPPGRAAADGEAIRAPLPPAVIAPVAASPAVPPVSAAGSTDVRGIVEQLIDRTVLPAPLPGLEIRLVPPDRPVNGEAHAPAITPQPPTAPEEGPPAAPASPPALNIDAIADRVYQTLQRRQQFERERRGLY